jgi:hypothetical protein
LIEVGVYAVPFLQLDCCPHGKLHRDTNGLGDGT